MVDRAVLIKEIDSLSCCYYAEVLDFVNFIKGKKINETLSLEKAAEIAAKDYYDDKELTAFCVLDGEGFY